MKDPEGNPIEFVQERPELTARHAGCRFEGHDPRRIRGDDRDAEDKFYKDLLGFHLYWQGGMKEGETDWVDMQVPDGTQWLEYMLVKEDSNSRPKTWEC